MTELVHASYKILTYSPGSSVPGAYRNLIFSKWLRSLRYGNDYFKLIATGAYYATYHKYIEVLLNRPTSTVRLAVLTDDPDVVLGWAVIEPGLLHFVHVHKDIRKQGIAKALVPADTAVITHLTKIGLSIWSKHPSIQFDPFK